MNVASQTPASFAPDALHIGLFLIALLVSAGAFWLWTRYSTLREDAEQFETDQLELRELRQQNAELTATTRMQTERVHQLEADRAAAAQRAEQAEQYLEAAKAREEERALAVERERASLTELREEVQSRFHELAQAALRQSQQNFMETANETFAKHKEGARGDLEKLISPMTESFQKFHAKVEAIEKTRAEDKSALTEQIKAVGETLRETTTVTSKLVTALSAPKGGGRWGEESLRNVLEMAGLSAHADFVEQATTGTDKGIQRPDVIIKMPGGREIAVDSKVSIDDFLKAADEPERARRDQYLANHARNVRAHVKRLAEKAYWSQLEDRVDFVAMFIPGENFYAAALEYERDLFDYATRNKVIIVTPSTLIALAKAVAYGWRQEQAASNAREAATMARDLYERLCTLGDKIVKLGGSVSKTVSHYNEMIGSLENSVLPQARKFQSMGLAEGGKEIPQIEDLNATVRDPKPGRDLLLTAPDDAA